MGDKPIIPQLLTLMAVVATVLAFPIMNPFTDTDYNFMCVEYEINEVEGYQCIPLYLNNQVYWSDSTRKGWAGAIQAAAIFGILAVASGFMAFSLLATASCFVLKLRRLLAIVILDVVCAVFTLLTFIAGGADICQNQENCVKQSVRVETGAGFMIFALIFYIAAGGATAFWFYELRSEQVKIKREEKQRLTQSLGGPKTGTVVTKFVRPDGTTRVEREYVDETGQKVKEITNTDVGTTWPEGQEEASDTAGTDF